MNEYIKKSEAVDVIVKYPYDIAGKTATAIKMIEDLPSADVVEVVRCKDCKWWYDRYIDPLTNYHYGCCERPLGEYYECDCDLNTTNNDYCSYGERGE